MLELLVIGFVGLCVGSWIVLWVLIKFDSERGPRVKSEPLANNNGETK